MNNTAERAAFSIDETCQYINASRPTVYKLMGNGSIPSFHIGRCRLILREDLDRFLQGRLAEAGYGASE